MTLRKPLALGAVLLVTACYRPTYEIEIEVRSSVDESPVAGAEVSVAARGWGRSEYIVWDREYEVSGETDGQGRYRAELVSAPIGLPAGGQQPHMIRISKPGFDTLFTTLPVKADRVGGTLVLEPAGTTREKRRLQEEASQRIREVLLRLHAQTLVVEVALKPDTVFPCALTLELRVGDFRCAEQRIEVPNATRSVRWSVEHATLLDCYVEKSGVRGGAIADVFVRVDARVEQANEFGPAAAVREERKVELDFVSDDPSERSISLVGPASQR